VLSTVIGFIVLASEEVAEEEPSKTLFYICGGALAVWALIVSAIGIKAHETFPPSQSARNGVIAISVGLVLLAMASAVITG
jgi:hypothetical protein